MARQPAIPPDEAAAPTTNPAMPEIAPNKGNGADTFDEYHPDNLRAVVDPLLEGGVKKVFLRIPLRKPSAETAIRVHPDPAYRVDTRLLILKEERETYLVAKAVRDELSLELKLVRLFTVITRQAETCCYGLASWTRSAPTLGTRPLCSAPRWRWRTGSGPAEPTDRV